MATYEALVFQPELYKQELFKVYDKALDEAVNYIERNFKPDGGTETARYKSGTGAESTITANSLRAWVVEYGAGIEADTGRNPYWGEYLGSGLTSRSRAGGRVVKRGRGSYQTFDTDSGLLTSHEGQNPQGGYLPQGWQEQVARTPQPFLQEMLEQAYKEFESKANSLSKSVNPEKFFTKSIITV